MQKLWCYNEQWTNSLYKMWKNEIEHYSQQNMTKLNSFILPDDVAKEMMNKLKEGFKKEIELGFSLCLGRNSNILKIGEHCAGGECSVTIPSKCEENDKYAGSYHTHPHESSRPSSLDIPTIYNRGLACIGGIENDKEEIKCYMRNVPKNIDVPSRFRDRLIFIRDHIERRKEIDKFVKDNFMIVDVI